MRHLRSIAVVAVALGITVGGGSSAFAQSTTATPTSAQTTVCPLDGTSGTAALTSATAGAAQGASSLAFTGADVAGEVLLTLVLVGGGVALVRLSRRPLADTNHLE